MNSLAQKLDLASNGYIVGVKTQKKRILVTGNFNILHPGHIRLLRFAKECGDELFVAVNSDDTIGDPEYLSEEHRLEVVSSLAFVDQAFINSQPVTDIISELRPWAVVKGKEHENRSNPEKVVLNEIGGKLIFASGIDRYSSQSYLYTNPNSSDVVKEKLNGFLKRHDIQQQAILDIVQRFQEKNVLVIGDAIVDQYIQCDAVGMSQEDPTIVVTPNESTLFLGGAGIVAGHAKSLGSKEVDFFTIVGQDKQNLFVKEQLSDFNVNPHLFEDDTRPTILKTRYRVGSKTMLRVNEVRSHDISKELQDSIFERLKPRISSADLILFSDFNYGMLPQDLVDQICDFARNKGVILAADSQTSSQVGDISRFVDMDLITPTEREVRVALKNDKDGLVILAQKLTDIARCKHLIVTLGDEGVLIHHPKEDKRWENDRVKALAANLVDPAGAGDCLLTAASLAITCGANLWEASFIGSVAAACQVGYVGNSPLETARFKAALNQFW